MAKLEKKDIRCSFCGKPQDEVERIIAGPGVYICDECIKVCTNIIENDLYEDSELSYEKEIDTDLPKPSLWLLGAKNRPFPAARRYRSANRRDKPPYPANPAAITHIG